MILQIITLFTGKQEKNRGELVTLSHWQLYIHIGRIFSLAFFECVFVLFTPRVFLSSLSTIWTYQCLLSCHLAHALSWGCTYLAVWFSRHTHYQLPNFLVQTSEKEGYRWSKNGQCLESPWNWTKLEPSGTRLKYTNGFMASVYTHRAMHGSLHAWSNL